MENLIFAAESQGGLQRQFSTAANEQIVNFVVNATIQSGYQYYYIRDKDSVIRFFKKLTDLKGITVDSLDTLIKVKKRGGSKEYLAIIFGGILLVSLAFFAGRWTVSPTKVDDVNKTAQLIKPTPAKTPLKPEQSLW